MQIAGEGGYQEVRRQKEWKASRKGMEEKQDQEMEKEDKEDKEEKEGEKMLKIQAF